jgi:Caspase domain
MPTAILVVFEYKTNILTGARMDLEYAYKWCQSFNCDIHVFTDIESEDYISTKNKSELESGLIWILKHGIIDHKLVLYYSGHGIMESMVMPDQGTLLFIDFRNIILSNLSPQTEIFWILDCCNPLGLYLPYKLNENGFSLTNTTNNPPSPIKERSGSWSGSGNDLPNDMNWKDIPQQEKSSTAHKIIWALQPILLITSAKHNEKSVATKSGSLFSKCLFELLTDMNHDRFKFIDIIPISINRNLRRLIGNLSSSIRTNHTGYQQTVSIYSSYIFDPILWMWVGSNKYHDIVSDASFSTLIIRPY